MKLHFPRVVGTNLLREEKVIPDELESEISILVVAFQQWQQAWVDSWVPTLEKIVTTNTIIDYYELPTIRRMNPIYRRIIDGGMRAGIPSNNTRRRTITLYIDKDPFKEQLGIDSEDSIYIYIVQRNGEILHSLSGSYSQDGERELFEIIENLIQL